MRAQSNRYEGQPVVRIEFEPEQQPLARTELAEILPVKENAPLRLDDVRSAIKRLYATGRYQDIQVRTEMSAAGPAIRFVTTPSWFVGGVEVETDTSDPPSRGRLVSATRLQLGQAFRNEQIATAVEGILDLLRSNGFYEAEVRPTTDYDARTQQVHLRFLVTGGKRARLGRPNVTGDLKMPEEKVISATKWKRWWSRWSHATHENVVRGVDRVRSTYQDQDRLMASVKIEAMDYDPDKRRVTPTLNVDAGPKVEIHVTGADISRRKLEKYIPIYAERTVDRDLMVEGAQNLGNYFQAQGYFDVDIDFEQQLADPDHYDINYEVDLGRRQKVEHVEIRGNRYFDRETIRERMIIQPAAFIRFRRGRFSDGLLGRDEEAIRALYRSNGFREVKVTSEVIDNYQGQQDGIGVMITIEEGPQWFVADLEVDGISQVNRDEVISNLSSIPGQPFSEVNVASDRDYILSFYTSRGFPDVAFDWDMQPETDKQQTRLHYVVAEGRERLVRDVLIGGMEATRPRLINPAIHLQPGGPLSLQQMTQTQRNLYDLGIFTRVDMAIQNPEGQTQHKYVLYQLDEGHKYFVAGGLGAEVARIGGGQNSFDAPAGSTGFSPRVSLEVSRLNFLGLGHSVNFKSRLSTLQRRALLNYSAPRYRNVEGRNISVTALYDDSRDVRTFSSKREEFSAQLSQLLSKAYTALYRFSYRNVSVDRSTLKITPLLIPLLSQPVRIGMMSGTLIQDKRDDPTDSHKGIYSTLDLGLASRFFASRRDFLRFLGRNSTYHPLGKTIVLARSTSLGILAPFRLTGRPFDSDQAIPLPERFFGGGGVSHRGFPDNQAGPRDLETGFPIGGRALLFNNTELRFPLLGDNINGVLFHDAGNVYSRIGNVSFRVRQRDVTDFDYMVHAVGFGVRYRTPIGPVRLDVAYSINPPRFVGFKGSREDLLFGRGERTEQRVNQFQFFFSIGQTF